MTFVWDILVLVFGHFVFAVLAITRGTYALRIAMWPVILLLAWRAVIAVDKAFEGSDQKSFSSQFSFWMVFIVTRTLDWSLKEAPLVRRSRANNGSQPTIISDALDLVTSMRGHGWEWSDGVHIPRETRTTNRGGFTFYVVLSVIAHTLMCNVLYRVILSLSPTGLGSVSGASIFDDTLPFYTRYLRSTIVSVLSAFCIYSCIQVHYDISTIVGVLLCGQEPAQWPPIFDAPWRATSLIDFWGRRWHQYLRRTFLVQGGYPLGYFLGKEGLVIGVFLSSAAIHHIGAFLTYGKIEPWRILIGFGMMGPLVLVERAFKRWTGRRVEGWAGWVWTMAWLVLLGSLIIDGLARTGMFGYGNFVLGAVPGHEIVERLVANFDGCLHTMSQ